MVAGQVEPFAPEHQRRVGGVVAAIPHQGRGGQTGRPRLCGGQPLEQSGALVPIQPERAFDGSQGQADMAAAELEAGHGGGQHQLLLAPQALDQAGKLHVELAHPAGVGQGAQPGEQGAVGGVDGCAHAASSPAKSESRARTSAREGAAWKTPASGMPRRKR